MLETLTSFFNKDVVVPGGFNSFFPPMTDIFKYPNLQKHEYLVKEIKKIYSLDIGESYHIDDLKVEIIDYDEFSRPICISDNIMYIMKSKKFNIHHYWIFILLTLYLNKESETIETVSYKEIYMMFKDYMYISSRYLNYNDNFINLKQYEPSLTSRSFVDVLFVIAINNPDRIIPETIGTLMDYLKDSMGWFFEHDNVLLHYKEKISQNFYFRPI